MENADDDVAEFARMSNYTSQMEEPKKAKLEVEEEVVLLSATATC